MRLTGGAAANTRIAVRGGSRTRATAHKVREALFTILGARVEDARVLDLCAGSGALGLEAASRGAAEVVLVERDRGAVAVLRRNVAAVQCGAVVRILQKDAVAMVRRYEGAPFALVLADPPYAGGLAAALVAALAESKAVGEETWVVVEHHHKTLLPDAAEGLVRFRTAKYGETRLSFYRRS